MTQKSSSEEEIQRLRDENNRLKGEQGKPDIKANKKKGFNNTLAKNSSLVLPDSIVRIIIVFELSKNKTIKWHFI